MALKFNWKKNLSKIIWSFIALVLAVCLIRVIVWEHNYYKEKEGSTRATAVANTIAPEDTENDVNEDDVTEQMKQAWKVAADKPRFLSIDKLGIDRARVLEVGITNSGRLQTPDGIFDVGWYRSSGKPGQGGTLLIDGHNGGPTMEGVFKHLPELEIGDIITIERGDGKFYKYEVVENEEVPLSSADAMMARMMTTPTPGKESLSLISCTGTWSQVQATYLSRQFLRATLVEQKTEYKKTEIKNELKEKREKAERGEIDGTTNSDDDGSENAENNSAE